MKAGAREMGLATWVLKRVISGGGEERERPSMGLWLFEGDRALVGGGGEGKGERRGTGEGSTEVGRRDSRMFFFFFLRITIMRCAFRYPW